MSLWTQSAANWSSLPETLWLSIFSRCHSIDLLVIKDVCHQWRRIAGDLFLTSCLDLRSKAVDVVKLKELLDFVTDNLVVLKINNILTTKKCMDFNELIDSFADLSIGRSDTLMIEVMDTLRQKCSQLRRLSLEGITNYVPYDSLPNGLTHLSLIYCRSDCLIIFDSNVDHLLTKFASIVYLNISHFNVFDSQMCHSINSFVSLKYLYMESLFRINDGGLSNITPKLISQMVVIDLEGTDVTDESLQYILNNGQSLEDLYLGQTLIKANIDFRKSEAKHLKKLCLLKTNVSTKSVLNILRYHSTLCSVRCDETIKMTIDSPIMTSNVQISGLCKQYVI
ncbi:F-box/LRR-repeat protein 12-like [Oppia nitens]|uniref:F-box/LRR-repeat protein 12-like n=1 Tax=Oppia nitens TaxID=1686743 RepID=UPI0023D97EB3|nr:F-box/LRR-repeat protein 12-like [Oppia nitens]